MTTLTITIHHDDEFGYFLDDRGVPCPYCEAAPGKPCVTTTTYGWLPQAAGQITHTHKARRDHADSIIEDLAS